MKKPTDNLAENGSKGAINKGAADLYRLEQAKELLRSLGWKERADGSFARPSKKEEKKL